MSAGAQSETLNAPWIGDGKPQPVRDEDFYRDDPAPVFRRSFVVGDGVGKVRLRIVGLGLYRAELNGKRIGRAELAPLWTPFGKRVLFDSYDLTDQVVPGKNTLTVRLGNGWYNPLPMRMWGRFNLRDALTVGRPALTAEIEMSEKDGQTQTIRTDENWEVADTPLLRNNLYLGEVYDARGPQAGAWRKAVLVQGPPGRVLPAEAPQVVERHAWKAVDMREVKPGVYVADMGRNFAGVASFRLGRGPAGRRITFLYGERAYADGTVNPMTSVCGQIKRKGLGGAGAPEVAVQSDVYIRNGTGDEAYQPAFTWHVFRYVQMTGLDRKPDNADVIAHAWSCDVKDVLAFECSNERVNTLHRICGNTFTSNLMGIQSDCPGRERFGYGGDIAVTAEAYILNYDMHDFYLKVLQDFADEAADDGFLPGEAPFVGFIAHGYGGHSDAFGWALCVPILMDKLVQYYGDLDAVRRFYPVCARFLDKTLERNPDLIIPSCNGDHEALAGEKPDEKLTVMAHFHQFARLTGKFAGWIGKPDDARKWNALADRLQTLFRTKYIVDGKVGGGRQSEQIFGLYHGLVPKPQVPLADRILRENLASYDGAFTTGIFGTCYLVDLYPEFVERNITRDDAPGYGHMIARGATTLWETWKESDGFYSQNHPMFGSVDAWVVRDLLGIRVAADAVGADRLVVAPVATRDVDWAHGCYQTIHGPVKVSWEKTGNRRHLTLDLPEGTSARVRPGPDGVWFDVTGGHHEWR